MPELPDIELYGRAIERVAGGSPLREVKVFGLSLLRSVTPPLSEFSGQPLLGTRRIGKRIVLVFPEERFLVLHLMIAGRLLWKPEPPPPGRPAKIFSAYLVFDSGTLMLTEAGTKKRAWLKAVQGEDALQAEDPGGLEPLGATLEQFSERLLAAPHTLKRALAMPRILSGIGNAYSDEILFHAGLSPVRHCRTLKPEEVDRLYHAMQETLLRWTEKLLREHESKFPGKGAVTAFRPDFAVHGRYGLPCPQCSNPVQRIRYEDNETNYCAQCQNEGRLLADRSLSRLLKDDWPKTLEELVAE